VVSLPRPGRTTQRTTGPRTKQRPVLALLGTLLVAALAATGCVSMPTGGPVTPTPVSQGTDAQNQSNVQVQPQLPGANWGPQQIVEGFLTASASYGSYPWVADAYLAPLARKSWNPSWSAFVYKSGPTPSVPVYASTAKNTTTATVSITGVIQASLGTGTYSVPSSTQGSASDAPGPFTLVKIGGQWRISYAPGQLLLTSNAFANDYQLRDLYFFDPHTRFLVPDPVYVPVKAKTGDLLDGLVNELIAPPGDWLSGGATRTAFPKGTKVTDVTLDGVTPVVNLTGKAIGKASTAVMEQLSAQLLWTLSNAQSCSTSQQVQSVEVIVNGKQWPTGEGGAVQGNPGWRPACGSEHFYYLASNGYLTSRSGTGSNPVAKIGTGYSQIAVSADGKYLAALHGTTLYAGLVGGPLTKRGTGFLAMSWDTNDYLWASASQGNQILLFRSTQNPKQPLTQPVPVTGIGGPVTALQVAPDGVRVAMVIDNQLTFGAIAMPQPQSPSQSPKISLSLVQDNPPAQSQSGSANAAFTSLTWYGSDYVIALSGPAPAVTEYPVSGAPSPTSIQAEPGMQTIAASSGQPLVTSLPNGQLMSNASLTGSWMHISNGDTPAKGSSPIYP